MHVHGGHRAIIMAAVQAEKSPPQRFQQLSCGILQMDRGPSKWVCEENNRE